MNWSRRQALACFLAACLFLLLYRSTRSWNKVDPLLTSSPTTLNSPVEPEHTSNKGGVSGSFWRKVPARFPAVSTASLPQDNPANLRHIQLPTSKFSRLTLWYQLDRQSAVEDAFKRSWTSYKSRAWLADELAPMSGLPCNGLGGWATTLIDNLDTLWVMGMREDFDQAVAAVANINFEDTLSPEINTHEVNIRILGGLLSAYDLSGDPILLQKSIEVGDMLYTIFDTPNRMPIIHWDLHKAARQEEQQAEEMVSASELGSFILEFTRLSQITRDPKYFDAAQNVMTNFEQRQDQTRLPGMWPVTLNARTENFGGDFYTMGAEVDSFYKTLPKAHILLGGHVPMYRSMYERFTRTAASHSLFRPLNAEGKDILLPGSVRVTTTQNEKQRTKLEGQVNYRGCFAGGLFAMGGQLFNIPAHRQIANKLVDGCIWAHEIMPMGIMPERLDIIPCASQWKCPWNKWFWRQEVWKKANNQREPDQSVNVDAFIKDHSLPEGVISIPDTRYNLRPEMIESMLILHRVTAREDLLDVAWEMFLSVQNATGVEKGDAAVVDVTAEGAHIHIDSMESYWMSRTLKYFYLMFSSPDLLSMNDYVFTSGGHPLKIPKHVEVD